MSWLEVLNLITDVGNRRWALTSDGKNALNNWITVTPEALDLYSIEDIPIIKDAPSEISILLQQLSENPEKHKKRNTYNIWAPSPNKIENLRKIINYAYDKVSKVDLFKYIENEFHLKISSAESIMPFLRASGFIEEVGRGIYAATSASKAWIDSGYDLDFIRILHSHMRFVGEMIAFAKNDVSRNEVYAEAKKYGLNNEKARWIAGFLLEANLLEEPKYLHLKMTVLGSEFIKQLPIASYDDFNNNVSEVYDSNDSSIIISKTDPVNILINSLKNASCDPSAENKAPGVAFEEAIANVFSFMGFDAKRIGGQEILMLFFIGKIILIR